MISCVDWASYPAVGNTWASWSGIDAWRGRVGKAFLDVGVEFVYPDVNWG